MSNRTLFSDKYRGYDVLVVETSYGALIATWFHKLGWGGGASKTWLGGFVNEEEAQAVVLRSVDADILFEAKYQKAREAFDAVMKEG